MNPINLNNLLELFFHKNKNLGCILNSQGEVIEVNQEWIKTLGHPNLPIQFTSFLPKEEVTAWSVYRHAILSSMDETQFTTNGIKTKGEKEIAVNWECYKYEDLVLLIGKKTTEQAICNKKLSALLEATSDAIYWGNIHGNFEYVNERACQMLGYTKKEFSHLTVFDIDKNTTLEDIKELENKSFHSMDKRQHHSYSTETIHRKKNGEYIPVEVNSTRVWIDSDWSVLTIVRDISERKQREMDLLNSQKLLNDSQKVGNIGCWEYFIETGETIWTDQTYEICGINRSIKPSLKIVQELIHPEDRALSREKYHKSLENGIFPEFKCRIIRSDETSGYIKIYGKIEYDEDNKPYRAYGIIQDITECKKQEESLLLFKTAIDKTSNGVFLLNKNGGVEYVNHKACKDLGYTNNEMLKMTLSDIDSDISKEVWSRMWEQFKYNKEGEDNNVINKIYQRKNGTSFPIEVLSYYFSFNNEEFVLSIVRDISERKRYEKELAESKMKMQRIFDIAPVGLVVVKDRVITKMNSHLCKISGYSEEELLNASTQILYTDKNEFEQTGKQLYRGIKEGGISNVDAVWKRKDGTLINALLHIALIDADDLSKGVVASVLDITSQKRHQKQLTELNMAKDKFFRIIGHDLRNPFGSIMGLSEIMIEQLNEFTEQNLWEMLTHIHKSSKSTYHLLENLLTWSRSQSGDIEFKPTLVFVQELINDTIYLLAENARQKNIQLKVEIDEELRITADENMISTIIRNLTSNAIKFTREQGQVTISTITKNDEIIFSIADNGVGIEEGDIDKLFKIDGEYSTPGTNNEQGTGLGLVLCKEFVDKHNGKLWVESIPGEGSTFNFSIPIG